MCPVLCVVILFVLSVCGHKTDIPLKHQLAGVTSVT
jgi:hypothetical protein